MPRSAVGSANNGRRHTDPSPLNYLVLIGEVDVLMFGLQCTDGLGSVANLGAGILLG